MSFDQNSFKAVKFKIYLQNQENPALLDDIVQNRKIYSFPVSLSI
jgi:hypothetical protein